MGVNGHMLGERKLRQLNRQTGMLFDRAYNRDGAGEARLWGADGCEHYWVDYETWEVKREPHPVHWASCSASQPEGV